MSTTDNATSPGAVASEVLFFLRGAFGGLLMGLANLVPGISGGTMLLATGVYPEFIGGIAEITTFRFRRRSLLFLGSVVAMAGLAILVFAGPTKDLVVGHRWVMYSLFIGLTLGGVPIVWRLGRPPSGGLWTGLLAGLALMVAIAFGEPASSPEAGPNYLLLFVAGIAGASAMILPGASGGYLLLLLGQYLPILGAIDDLKRGLLAPSLDGELIVGAIGVMLPVAVGVVAGVVAVSNLLRWLLDRYRKPTLGVLLGLLVGAVVGLWPFQQAVPPEPGQVIRGVRVTASNRESIDREDWPTRRFAPTGWQVARSIGLVAAGFVTTQLIGQLGRGPKEL